MFLFIRRNTVNFLVYILSRILTKSTQIQNQLQASKPVNPIFVEFAEILSPYKNVEDRLLSKAMHIPKLQSLANSFLLQPSCNIDVSKALRIIRAAEHLYRELANWARRIPINWTYTTVTCIGHSQGPQISSSNCIPNQIHRYPNFYAARVWNSYLVYRLIIESILVRVSSCVHLHLADHNEPYIEKINRTMVEDVCVSVPFILGYELSELKSSNDVLQNENFLWLQSSINKASTSTHTGKFSLIWPLYIACNVLSVPETQRIWMRAQLRWIAETG
jgi:hypothetical protein